MRLTVLIAIGIWLLSGVLSPVAVSQPLLPPGSATAVLVPGGDAESAPELGKQAGEAVESVLREMGYRVLGPGQVSEELKRLKSDPCRVLRTCDQAAVLRALKFDAVASVAFWLGEKGAEPQQVVVRITRRDNWGVGEVAVGEAGLLAAVRVAVALAIEEASRRREVTLRIESLPAGAEVEVDHRRAGVAPLEIEVLPGKRVITLSARGFVTESELVEVPAGAKNVLLHRVALSRVEGSAPAGDAPLSERRAGGAPPGASSWNYALGGGLVAASVPLVVFPLVTALNHNECYEQDEFDRCKRYYFGIQSALLLAGGLASLAGGLTLVAVAPISNSADSPRISLTASPVSAGVRGEF